MISIKCGHCSNRHQTVAQVRLCSRRATPAPVVAPVAVVKPVAKPVSEPGMYRMPNGRMFRVQENKSKTGLYAKELIVTNVGDLTKSYFAFVPGIIRDLQESYRITIEEAMEFGMETGVCCQCGRLLTASESVKNGIGPICASRL